MIHEESETAQQLHINLAVAAAIKLLFFMVTHFSRKCGTKNENAPQFTGKKSPCLSNLKKKDIPTSHRNLANTPLV